MFGLFKEARMCVTAETPSACFLFYFQIFLRTPFFFTPSFSSFISTPHLQCHGFLFPPYYCERHGMEVAVVTGPVLIGGDSCTVRG